jgi:3-oxoacyl-[acyl-carrier-protein] synthase-3
VPKATFRHARVVGIDVCPGPVVRHLEEDAAGWSADANQVEKLRRAIGVESRWVAPPGVTALDLCETAARRLLSGCGQEAAGLDGVICVTQCPDHFQPCNANILHGRLGLPKAAAAFDVNQGCSGWVYGLYLAFLMVEAGGCQRVLLLAGDTVTQSIHPGDRTVVPLFGDAGSATLIERTEAESPAWFSLCSDGQGWEAITIPAGGYRRPRTAETGLATVAEDGSRRSADDLFMNGIEVFNFTLREEPRAVQELLAYAGRNLDTVDHLVFHQANRIILQTLALRLKVPMSKVPCRTLADYGNQSSASIPGTLCHDLGARLRQESAAVLCSGFGVGLSWASCLLTLGPLAHGGLEVFPAGQA